MAIAKTGPNVTELHNKSGGVVFRRDQFGQHVQSQPRLVRKRSLSQTAQRTYFTKACQFCKEHLIPTI